MNRGLIKQIGVNLDTRAYEKIAKVDVRGAWVTPGIFDMHSHLGVDSVSRALLFITIGTNLCRFLSLKVYNIGPFLDLNGLTSFRC